MRLAGDGRPDRGRNAWTVEIAAFDEFSKLLGDADATRAFDHVILDPAPTGHTLRLLELPAAWSTFIETNVGGTSRLGPLSGHGNDGRAVHRAHADPVRRSPAAIPARTSRPHAGRLAAASRLISYKTDSSRDAILGAPGRRERPWAE